MMLKVVLRLEAMALSSGVTISHKQVQKSAEDDERERERSRAGVLDLVSGGRCRFSGTLPPKHPNV